uniref:Amino acid ABC transporter substrate-binding protein n=1 Tax=Caldilinea aerophila TaxID=133453 RepID=A0A7C1JNP8_9CHLR
MTQRGRIWLVVAGVVALLGIGALGLNERAQEALGLSFLRRDETWEAIQQRGAWRVGLDPSFPPFEMLDAAGTPIGYDVDLAHALAASWGVRAEIVAIGFDSLPDALKAGKIDSIISAYPYDERLTQDFHFSTPYFDAGLRIAVRNDSTINELTDLAGARVGVEWGGLGDMVGRRLVREGLQITVKPFETPSELIAALLETDAVDAILIDNVLLRQAQASDLPLRAVGAPLESVPYAIVTPRRADELQRRLEISLQQLKADGRLDELEHRWFAKNVTENVAP